MMKNSRIFAAVIILFFLVFAPGRSTFAATVMEEVTTIVLQVHEKGFIDAKGNPIHGVIPIPKASQIKIVFEYDDSHGDDHEFAVLFPSDEEIYSEVLSEKNRRVEITFVSGKAGALYDVFCLVDCEAMDKLVDLILMAG